MTLNSLIESPKILTHSVSPDGDEIVTFEVQMHRFVLAEFNTHRVLAKNSASSRAIPVRRQLEMINENPAWPVSWPQEKSGMQGGVELEPDNARPDAMQAWEGAMRDAIDAVRDLQKIGLHKSVTNRLLEPFMWHKVVVTGTAWENFFRQRDHEDAQPEIRVVAEAMHRLLQESEPRKLPKHGWHLPYISDDDWDVVDAATDVPIKEAIGQVGLARTMARISAARCARTSYLTNPKVDADGKVVEDARVDHVKDLGLYDRLVLNEPRHWSPLEHPCTPWAENKQQTAPLRFNLGRQEVNVPLAHLPKVGPMFGYRTLRTEVEAMLGDVTFR